MNNIIIENRQAEEEVGFDVYSRLIQNRIIFVNDINYDENATDIVATLIHLDSISNEKISIFINSEGGDLRNVFMIRDTMRTLSSPIETICSGSVMRESVLLLAAGTKGLRLITKNSDICVSQITHSGVMYSDLTGANINHNKITSDNLNYLKDLAKCCNKSLKQITKKTERQVFLSPQEAVAFGLVDKVI